MELSRVTGIYRIMSCGLVAYVGSSVNVGRRKSQHLNALRNRTHKNFLLQRVFDKYGADGLTFELVEECDSDLLVKREQHHIDSLNPWCNLSEANGSHPHTDEAKDKMRAYALRRTDSHREAIRKANSDRVGKPNGRKGIPTGRVPKSAFKPGLVPWNKKYSDEELVEKRKEWNRVNGASYRERHAEQLREYKRLKAREYRARKKENPNG